MKMFAFPVLLLCGILGLTLTSTVKPVNDVNFEVLFLKQKINTMEKRLDLLENVPNNIQKVKEDILVELRNVEKTLMKEQNQLSEKVAEIESLCINKQNVLSSKLDDLEVKVSKQKEDILNKLSELEKASKLSIDEISKTLQNERINLLLKENNLLTEIYQLQKKTCETFQKVTDVEHKVKSVVEKRDVIESILAEHTKDIQEVKNNLLNQSHEMGNISTELLRIQTECCSPCENGGKYVNKICICPSNFTGDRCQTAVCTPPCKNGGKCIKNNTCICTPLFSGDRCQKDEPQCGLDYDGVFNNGSRKAGGDNNSALVLPWMAALYRNESTYICDGSVIHRRFVLMSAYCIYSPFGSRYRDRLNELTVKLGFTDLSHQTYGIRTIHIHPQYDFNVFGDYNIALLELEKQISYNMYIRPVCLPPKEIPEDNPFYRPQSSARGTTLKTYILTLSANRLKNVDFIIQKPDACNRKIKEAEKEKYYPSTDRTICAIAPDDSSCKNLNLGTPWMQSRPTTEGTQIWTQVGIKSGWCGSENYLFAVHVQNLMPWVDATVKAASNT